MGRLRRRPNKHMCASTVGRKSFWGKQPDEETKPGCIYSYAGIREYKISGMCEHCFDELMGGAQP